MDCTLPNAHKNAAASVEALQEFAGTEPIDILYSDGSHELTKAVKDIRMVAVEQASALIGIKHHKAIEYGPETNGVAERTIMDVTDGTRVNLYPSGLGYGYWGEAQKHC